MLHLHVRLHKTGTTFFRADVFPRWKGLTHIRNLNLERFLKVDLVRNRIISRKGLSGGVIAPCTEKLLHLDRLSRVFPNARIMLSIRQHSGYVNALYSHYRRFGGKTALAEFFDPDADAGVLKKGGIRFRTYIDAITDYWGQPPFVFLLSEVRDAFANLQDDVGDFLGVPPPPVDSIPRDRRNISLGRPQAEVLQKINALSNCTFYPDGSRRPYRLLRRIGMDPPNVCRWRASPRKNPPIIDEQFASHIDECFAEDLEFVKQCIQEGRTRIPKQ